jgi:hypothetical protein
LAAEKRWAVEDYRDRFKEVTANGFVEYDERAHVVWLPDFVASSPPHNPNVLKHWYKVYLEIPTSPLRDAFTVTLRDYLAAEKPECMPTFRATFAKHLPAPRQYASTAASPEPVEAKQLPLMEAAPATVREAWADRPATALTTPPAQAGPVIDVPQSERKSRDASMPTAPVPDEAPPAAQTVASSAQPSMTIVWPPLTTPQLLANFFNAYAPASWRKAKVSVPSVREKAAKCLAVHTDQEWWGQVLHEVARSPQLRDTAMRPGGIFAWLVSTDEHGALYCEAVHNGHYRDAADPQIAGERS